MSRKIKEKKLEEVAARKTTLPGQTIRAKTGDSAGMAKLRKTKTTSSTKAISKRRVVKTKAANDKKAAAETPMTIDEIIPEISCKLQEQESPRETGVAASVEAPPDTSLTLGQPTSCTTEALVPGTDYKLEELELPREIDAAASLEGPADTSSTLAQDVACATEVPALWDSREEKENVARESEVVSARREIEQPIGRRVLSCLAMAWSWTRRHLGSGQPKKRLRVCESVSLGEKRFVAVIEIDGEQFLVGGASSSVATLARLEPKQEFSQVLERRWAQDPMQA